MEKADQSSLQRAAELLLDAQATRIPCAPVRDLIGADDVNAAYAVQQQVTAIRIAAGATVTGFKLGSSRPPSKRNLVSTVPISESRSTTWPYRQAVALAQQNPGVST